VRAACFACGTIDLLWRLLACAREVPADHLIMVLSLRLSGHLLLSTGQFSRVTRIEMIAAITVGSAIPVDISKGARESAREWLMSGL
jgi:hypothetical protein